MIKSRKMTLSILALSLLGASQLAMATPGNISLHFECPFIKAHGTQVVTNYGNVITGPGREKVNENASTYPMVTGVNPGTIPMDLAAGEYTNAGTSYNPVNGVVSCIYASSNVSNPSFTLTHQLVNGFNGIVTLSSSEDINVKFMMGLKS